MSASTAVETQLLDAAEQLLPELGARRRENRRTTATCLKT
jgi:hypothetical protein